MKIDHIHHVAYRCKDAGETVEWYGAMLNEWSETKRAPRHAVWLHAKELREQ